MSHFEKAFKMLLEHEGGYSDNMYDPGGKTMFGVTEEVARSHGYQGEMKDLPIEVAEAVYRRSYWDDRFDELDYSVAFNLFDGVVNSGERQAVKWIQRAVYANDDGLLGHNTMSLIKTNPAPYVVSRYNAERLSFLTDLKTWSKFGKGWARRIAKNLEVV